MKNVWMLTIANLRKNKGQAFSMMIMITLAALFLSTGLIVLTGLGDFLETRAEELHTPHVIAIEERHATNNDRYELIESFNGVNEIETQYFVGGLGGFYLDDVFRGAPIYFVDARDDLTMNELTLVGEYLPLTDHAAYIPHATFLTGGFALGDEITLELLGTELIFTIAGSTEDVAFGGHDLRIQISPERLSQLEAQFPNQRFRMILARGGDDLNIQGLIDAYNREFFGTAYNVSTFGSPLFYPLNLELLFLIQMQLPSVVASIIAGFALIILVVAVIMVRFRITSSIEEGMTNIGVLKAMGYLSKQITASIVIQFALITFVGSLVGMLLTMLFIGLVVSTIEPATGIPWAPSISLLRILITTSGFVLLIGVFSYLTTLKISKLHPLVALRGGLATHNFQKNVFALSASGSLVGRLGLKQLVQNKKQALSIGLISAGLLVASILGLTTYYNVNVNTESFLEIMVGNNLPDVMIMVDNEDGGEAFIADLEAMSEVRELYVAEFMPMFADEVLITTTVVEDFGYLANDPLASGRLPIHDNEVVVGLPALNALGAEVGDFITLRAFGEEADFMITGVISGAEHQGMSAMISAEAMERIAADFVYAQFNVNLYEDVVVADFIIDMEELAGDTLDAVIDVAALSDVALDGITGVFATLTGIVLVASGGIIALVLYMVIKTTIRRGKQNLGIQKALGFTTWQLMNQISIGLMPIIVIGMTIGAVLGYLGFNPMFSFLMRGMGVTQTNFTVPLLYSGFITIGLVLFAYLICLLTSWRIRKISAYALVTE